MALGNAIRKFISEETSSAYLLLAAMMFALVFSNSPWHTYYSSFFHTPLTLKFADWQFKTDPLFLINEGLMSIFFLVVGLEIKYELLQGSLNTRAKALLPGIAAIGGNLAGGHRGGEFGACGLGGCRGAGECHGHAWIPVSACSLSRA